MRNIYSSSTFKVRLKRFLKQHPDLKKDILKVFTILKNDVYNPVLHTHRLHGKLKDSFACSINYHYRIVFSFDENLVYVESIGSHDDVY